MPSDFDMSRIDITIHFASIIYEKKNSEGMWIVFYCQYQVPLFVSECASLFSTK